MIFTNFITHNLLRKYFSATWSIACWYQRWEKFLKMDAKSFLQMESPLQFSKWDYTIVFLIASSFSQPHSQQPPAGSQASSFVQQHQQQQSQSSVPSVSSSAQSHQQQQSSQPTLSKQQQQQQQTQQQSQAQSQQAPTQHQSQPAQAVGSPGSSSSGGQPHTQVNNKVRFVYEMNYDL